MAVIATRTAGRRLRSRAAHSLRKTVLTKQARDENTVTAAAPKGAASGTVGRRKLLGGQRRQPSLAAGPALATRAENGRPASTSRAADNRTSAAAKQATYRPNKRKPAAAPSPAEVGGSAHRRRKAASSAYDDVIGRIVDIPAHVFDVDVPELYYRGLVKKKDTAHARAVVVRFPDDGSSYWMPVEEVRKWLTDMERRGRTEKSKTFGEASDAFAAEVLAEFSAQRSCSPAASGGSTVSCGAAAAAAADGPAQPNDPTISKQEQSKPGVTASPVRPLKMSASGKLALQLIAMAGGPGLPHVPRRTRTGYTKPEAAASIQVGG